MNQARQQQSETPLGSVRCRGANRLPAGVVLAPLALAVAAASLGVAAPALAQSDEKQMVELEEVIVTARRREESLQDVPIAITAMSADFLREQNITELNDLGTRVPALSVSSTGQSSNVPIVVLRGQRPTEVTLTVDPAVPSYFADVALTPAQGTNLAMYDLASVQVLKGPQGTLFGRNSTGGALLFTPQTPGDEFGGYAEARLGDYNLYHVEGAVDLPASDALAFRVAGRSLDRDGYQSNVADNALKAKDKYWDENSWGLRLTASFAPNERLRSLTTVAYDENDMLPRVPVPQAHNSDAELGQLMDVVHNGGLGALNSVWGTPGATKIDDALARQRRRDATEIEVDLRGSEKIENWFAANTTEFELSDALRIKNIFGYRELDYRYSTDTDGTAVQVFGSQTSATETVTSNPPLASVEGEQYSEELQLLGSAFDDRLDWIVGGYWFRMEGSQSFPLVHTGANPDWPVGPAPLPDPQLQFLWTVAQKGLLGNAPAGDAENEAWAVFGEGTYTLDERWSVTLGARQSWDDRSMTAKNFALSQQTLEVNCQVLDENNVPLPDDACAREVDESFDHATWRAIVNYTPSEDMLVYASVSTGYRTGGLNGRGTSNFSLVPFDEETVLNYELGHKTDWQLGDVASMRTNLAIYLQQYEDIQKTVSGTNPETLSFETYVVNAAEAEIAGFDFDVLIAPSESLLITLAYAFVDGEYKEWDREYLPGSGNIQDFSDAPFVYVPEHSVTGSLRYTLPLEASIGEVALMASVYWQDETEANDAAWLWPTLGWSQENLDEALASNVVEDYAVWNFRVDWLGVIGSRFDLAAFVNNAADEEYITGGLNVPDSLGWAGASYGPPRTWGASLRYSF